MALPAALRFFRDVSARHITMMLEARIGREGSDYFEFPGKSKKGSMLSLDMSFTRGKIGHGNPSLKSTGVVQSNLAIPIE
jgi:hypothetical protein